MKFLLIWSCLLSMAYANCEDEDTCFCQNITAVHYEAYGGFYHTEQPDGRLFYSEGPGCSRNLTCQLSSDTYFVSVWEDSTIPKPKDMDGFSGITIPAGNPDTQKTGSFVDLQELFGIVCEDFKWMITKYPYGYSYTSEGERIHVDASKIARKAHKTEVGRFYCDGEAHDIEYYSQL